MSRATINRQFQVILRAADGTEWTWPITDNYFQRRLDAIGKRMLTAIRQHDLSKQFKLSNEKPSTAESKFRVSLIRLEDCTVQRETFLATDSYAAVAKAFKYFAHKPQADCLDTWKVYGVEEIES